MASILVVVSLMMSSIVRLRWINLAGAALMSVYGVLIHALPVTLLNLFIVIVDLYYLKQIYFSRNYFDILQPRRASRYLQYFLDFYRSDIQTHMPDFNFELDKEDLSFFVLRNMVPACLFVAKPSGDGNLAIKLDFVIPEYRDFKIGKFLFEEKQTFFPSCGFTTLIATATTRTHADYLKKMGFEPSDDTGGATFKKQLPLAPSAPCPLECSCHK